MGLEQALRMTEIDRCKFTADRVATILYSLKGDGAALLDSFAGGDSFVCVRSRGNLVAALEKAFEDNPEDGSLAVSVAAAGGTRLFAITAVIGDMVRPDGNRPLADQTLHFDVQLVGAREATTEELDNGHVHGAGDHH